MTDDDKKVGRFRDSYSDSEKDYLQIGNFHDRLWLCTADRVQSGPRLGIYLSPQDTRDLVEYLRNVDCLRGL